MADEKNLRQEPEEDMKPAEEAFDGLLPEEDYFAEEAVSEEADMVPPADGDIDLDEPTEETGEGNEAPALSAQAYDRLPDAPETEEDPYEGKEGVDIEYDLTGDEVMRGLLLLQKKQIYRRNIIYSAVLGIIFVLYVVAVVRDPSYSLGIFLMLLSATVIGFIWYLPYRHRKSTAKAMDLHEGKFTMTVYDTGICVRTEHGPQNFLYDKKFKVWDNGDQFLIDVDRYRIYILPKRCMDSEAQEKLTEYFTPRLQS